MLVSQEDKKNHNKQTYFIIAVQATLIAKVDGDE